MAQKADLILYVVDSSVPLDENDEEIMEMLTGKRRLSCIIKLIFSRKSSRKSWKKNRTSGNSDFCKRRKGITELEEQIKDMFLEERFPLMMRYILQMPVIKQHWKRLTEALIWSETVSKWECRKISFL